MHQSPAWCTKSSAELSCFFVPEAAAPFISAPRPPPTPAGPPSAGCPASCRSGLGHLQQSTQSPAVNTPSTHSHLHSRHTDSQLLSKSLKQLAQGKLHMAVAAPATTPPQPRPSQRCNCTSSCPCCNVYDCPTRHCHQHHPSDH